MTLQHLHHVVSCIYRLLHGFQEFIGERSFELGFIDRLKSSKTAFTLAETLITMTIIGVIAALTIPALVNNYQQKSFDTAKAKFVSELSQGFTRYLADRNTNDLKYTPFATADGKRSFFDNYFKSATKCGNTLDDCFASDYIDTNGTALAQMNTLCNDAYTLKDGASGCIMAKDGWDGEYYDDRTKKNESYLKVYYDINGKNKPNIFGRDYYVSNIITDGSLVDNPEAPHSTTPSNTTPSDTTPSDTTPSETTPAYTVPKYKLTVTSSNCGAIDSSNTYAEGEKISIDTYPPDGYEFKGLAASGCSASGKIVTMKARACNVVAVCTSTKVEKAGYSCAGENGFDTYVTFDPPLKRSDGTTYSTSRGISCLAPGSIYIIVHSNNNYNASCGAEYRFDNSTIHANGDCTLSGNTLTMGPYKKEGGGCDLY